MVGVRGFCGGAFQAFSGQSLYSSMWDMLADPTKDVIIQHFEAYPLHIFWRRAKEHFEPPLPQ